jgi:hypothetical protein
MSASFFSRNVASRIRMVSRMPPASPAATMLVYRSVNTFGWRPSASLTVAPLSTSNTTARVTCCSALLSLCLARMSSACTSGRPALIIVENCRVKITMSRAGTLPAGFGLLAASSTLTTARRMRRSIATASSRVGASSVAERRSPPGARAV